MTTASGIGSWPGTDIRETLRMVRDTLGGLGASRSSTERDARPAPDASADRDARADRDAPDVHGLPYLPELPERGPGADLLGRSLGLLVALPVDLQPFGWRLTDRPGRDAGRTSSLMRQDLDELAEAFDGWQGPLKIQVAGPWTLGAGVWLPRGDRVLADEGGRRDLVESLAEGVRVHLEDVRRLVPGAEIVLQIDEPSLPAVLEGRLTTASGFGRVGALDPQEALAGLRAVVAAADGGETVIHCCAADLPLPMLRQTGAGLSIDTSLLTPRGWEGVALGLEEGLRLYAGCVPTASTPRARDLADTLVEAWSRVGLEPRGLDDLVVTPACGLGNLTLAAARSVSQICIDTAAALTERALS
ncbi:MAG: methionine synthase [Lapillicoccus sp.]